jgi:hypothetical protein
MGTPDLVGRKTRRAEDLADRLNPFAPVLSRAVGTAWPNDMQASFVASAFWELLKSTAMAKRTERLKTGADVSDRATWSWARRVFRPTSQGHWR